MLHSICQQIWKTQQWPREWKRSIFIPIPKKGNGKECSKYCTIALISHVSKVMLKILQTRLQQFMNYQLPDAQAGFRKGREPEIKLPTSIGSQKKQVFQKNIYFCFIDYAKAFDCVDQNKVWNIREMGIPNHLTCLLRNLYAVQEATVRTGHGTTDWFQIGKEYVKAVYCHPAYLAYMQSTSCKMPDIQHKLESRLQGEIAITSDMQMAPPLWQKVRRN